MFVFSNRRLGAAAEVLVSRELATGMLHAVAEAARAAARSHWEHELARWLLIRSTPPTSPVAAGLDVADVAWSPDHFAAQQRFVLAAIATAVRSHPREARALTRWAGLVEAHPRSFVQVGRRWIWQATA